MNKKILSGILIGSMALGVGLTCVPNNINSNIYNETNVVSIKRATNKVQSLKNEEIGSIRNFLVSEVETTSGNQGGKGYVSQKLILQKGWYCVKGDINPISFDSWGSSNLNPQYAYIEVNSFFHPTTDDVSNATQIEQRANDLGCSSFLGYLMMFKSDGSTPIEFRNTSVESMLDHGDLVKWDLVASDYIAPSITGTNNFIVNVNNMLSKDDIVSHIKAYDDTDGDLPINIDSCTYDPNNKKIGDYEMVVSATDNAGNKTTANIKIKVVDVDKPVINGTNTYTRSYNDPVSLETIKSALTINDNYDSGLELVLIQDNYTSNSTKVGTHTVSFKAMDSSNNESDVFTVTIKVEDKVKPVISGPGTINVPSNNRLSLLDFKKKFSINDGYDGKIELTDLMVTGYDTYLNNSRKVGSYTITITVADTNGNTATQNVTLVVEDKISPEIFFDDYFIVLEQGQSLTAEQIKDYASKVLGIKIEDIKEVSGEYDTNVAGTYNIEVKTINDATYRFSLKVVESTDKVATRKLNWYEYMYKWFSILFNFDNDYYRTENFFDFKTRCTKISELYSTGQYKYFII